MPETKRVGLTLRGNFLGCRPSEVVPPPGFSPIYWNVPGPAGVWNFIDLTKQDDGRFVAVFVDAKQKIRNDDTGAVNGCDPALPGSWAVARGAELPPDWPATLTYDNGACFGIVFL